MALSNEDLLKELSAKPIMEVVELVKMLEDEWGVSAAAPVAVAAGPAAGDAGEAEFPGRKPHPNREHDHGSFGKGRGG